MPSRRVRNIATLCDWEESGGEDTHAKPPPAIDPTTPSSHLILTPTPRHIDPNIEASAIDGPRQIPNCIQALVPNCKPPTITITEPIPIPIEPTCFIFFTHLPPELIETIYVYSRNLSLSITNHYLHSLLTQPIVRLRFCSHIFAQPLTHKEPHFHTGPVAVSTHEVAIVRLQTTLIAQPWFTTAFARQLEALTPPLQTLACERKAADQIARQGRTNSSHWPQDGTSGSYRLVWCAVARMPKCLLIGEWTDEKAELFLRLRSWWVEPEVWKEDWLCVSADRAREDGRADVESELRWYIVAAGREMAE